jgi:outer membrane protein assembly factor BamB
VNSDVGISLKSHIIREKKKVKREAIVSFISTSLPLHVRNKMKGNKMSAILAILLMLGGALFVPFRAYAGSFPKYDQPVSAIAVNVNPGGTPVVTSPPFASNLSVAYPTVKPNTFYSFYAYIDVINVTSLGAYLVGFTWNPTYLHVMNITDGGFLTSVKGSLATGLTPFTINNTIGEVDAVANALETPLLAPTGSGHLLKVGFNVTNFSPPYTGTSPGTFVNMIHLNVSSTASYATSVASNDTTTITPPQQDVYSGLFKMYVTPTPPTASFTMTPYPINFYNVTSGKESFDASASTGGGSGYGPSLPVSYYCWNFGDLTGWHNVTAAATLGTGTGEYPKWTYPAPPPLPLNSTYTVTLVVNNTAGKYSAPYHDTIVVKYSPKPVVVAGWPMFHHDLTHTGYSTSTAPIRNQTLWSYTTSGGVNSSPTVANGTVYVGSQDGKVYALNATTGKQIWNYTTGGAVVSSPAVAGGVVFVGSQDGKIYALNATTGKQIWNYPTWWEVWSSPAVANGVVFVHGGWDGTTWNGTIYALKASTGTLIWTVTTPGPSPTESSPAVADGIVFVGSGDGRVYALNATTGKQIWSYTTGGVVESSPAVVGGVVFVGSDDNRTYALNASTGGLLWRYATGGAVVSSPAVVGGVVFVGSDDGRVYALNAITRPLMPLPIWSYATGGAVVSSPAVAGGVVFVGSGDNHIYALNASTGSFVWRYATGGAVVSSPAVVGGVVFVGSQDGKIYAIGPPPYSVTLKAHSITNGADLNVPITMDSSPTGYTTPHTFVGLTGAHTFTVPNTNSSQSFKQWNTGETSTTITVTSVSSGAETAYYRTLPSVDASGVVGISGYKLVFKETLNNSLSLNVNVSYYWSFNVDKWNGTLWVATAIAGSSTPVTGSIISKEENTTYYVYLLNSSTVKWGDWLRVHYTFDWNYSSATYSIDCVAKLNVHPGDIAGAALVTFPNLGANGRVELADLLMVAINWKAPVSWTGKFDPTDALHLADIKQKGTIGIDDLMAIAFNWNRTWTNTPPPG